MGERSMFNKWLSFKIEGPFQRELEDKVYMISGT